MDNKNQNDGNNKDKELPLVPLEEVLECMKDSDPIVASAGRRYYRLHYCN